PDTVKAYVKRGLAVAVEAGAGAGAYFTDDAYSAAGASVVAAAECVKDADIILTVRRPSAAVVKAAKAGAVLIAQMNPHDGKDELRGLAQNGLNVFSMELMPRISRAQSMDVLSSQANLAGYKSVITAAEHFSRAFPQMMTAAGTVSPARVFVMGVGVAGLQAIATARRLGAIVSATDVRKATEEQVKSLGGKFIFADVADAATAGGYAKELSDEDKAKQAALIAEHIKTQDIIITTALIPGRPAPELVSQAMVESLKPGSVIVDLAAERGGNCPLTKAGETIVHQGVTIIGAVNLAGALAGNASSLYARNLQNFLDLIVTKDGALAMDWEDEIIKGTALVKQGVAVHPLLNA
ncbi:MAG: Re/Si-specific NAD(P)(+) transhydrogenase subunit alpha, partial [Aestuariivirgaceae bacterium]|nr:Re/Si-specific NAD(P)(+) transhydrogenase subunit alpha [Aestuariivirgaceae bacterium]